MRIVEKFLQKAKIVWLWSWIGCGFTLFLPACVKHLEFPPLGDPLPAKAKLEIPSSIKELTIHYSDSCGRLQEILLGDRLQEALQEGIHRTFNKTFDGTDNTSLPDYVIRVELFDSSFDLNKERLYDRAPAVLRLNGMTRVQDGAGALLRQTDIQIARQERLRLEQLSKNCDYMIDAFIDDSVMDFATRVLLNARQAVADAQKPAASTQPNQVPIVNLGRSSDSASRSLQFKATLLDENSDFIFEGGEHVRIRVDVVNTGLTMVEHASASLTGTEIAIERFPTTVLRLPPLQPGQTQSLEFVATLPPLAQPQQAEIRVTIEERAGISAIPQTLSFTIAPPASKR